jgi:hypothetical protein
MRQKFAALKMKKILNSGAFAMQTAGRWEYRKRLPAGAKSIMTLPNTVAHCFQAQIL